jgi:hypothetical protein
MNRKHTSLYNGFIEEIDRNIEYTLFNISLLEMLWEEMKLKTPLPEDIQGLLEDNEKIVFKSKKGGCSLYILWLRSTLICRNVDALEYYVSQIFLKVLINYPLLLISIDKKTDINNQNSVQEKAEYKSKHTSVLGIMSHLINSPEIKLDFNINTPSFKLICNLIETRHIIVHNNGYVDKSYIDKTGKVDVKKGSLFNINDQADVDGISSNLKEFAETVDTSIIAKFAKDEKMFE